MSRNYSNLARHLLLVAVFAFFTAIQASAALAATVSGTVRWQGSPVTGAIASSIHLRFVGPMSGGYVSIRPDGTYSFSYTTAGTYNLYLEEGPADMTRSNCQQFVWQSITLTGSNRTVDFDIGSAGKVVGDVKVPLPASAVISTSCHKTVVDTNGHFEMFFAPRVVTVDVNAVSESSTNYVAGSFTVPAVAGQVTNVGLLDFTSPGFGNLTLNLLWQGQPARIDAYTYVEISGQLGGQSPPNSATGPFWLTAGEHSIRVSADAPLCPPCDASKPFTYGQTLATVIANQASVADVDLTANVGRVVGTFTFNGAVLETLSVIIGGVTHTVNRSKLDVLLPPGNHHATVYDNKLDFTVVAGETTDLGTIDSQALSPVLLTVLWNGMPIVAPIGSESLNIGIDGEPEATMDSDGDAPSLSLSNGSHRIALLGCVTDADRLAETSVSVSGTTPLTIDLTPTAGMVKGVLTLNGQAVVSPNLGLPFEMNGALCPGWQASSTGSFQRMLRPGDYTLYVFKVWDLIGTVDFSITAGQVTDLGTVSLVPAPSITPTTTCEPESVPSVATTACVPQQEICNGIDDNCDGLVNENLSCDLRFGTAGGRVLWNGVPVTDQDSSVLVVQGTWQNYAQLSTGYTNLIQGAYQIPGLLAAGPQPVNVVVNGPQRTCSPMPFASTLLNIVADTAISQDIELAATAGRMLGTMTVNGVPLRDYTLTSYNAASCGFTGDRHGRIAAFMPPGRQNMAVDGSWIAVSIVAGETTTVKVDSQDTPGGVNVNLLFNGGLEIAGGTSLTLPLSAVSYPAIKHRTTVTLSDVGPDAPSGFRNVGIAGRPAYWDITTTNTFQPPAEVCIRYDETQIQGPASKLLLVRPGEDSFTDITTSIDTQKHVVCGLTTYVRGQISDPACAQSLFTLLEPVAGAVCGDAVCSTLESATTCPSDCGAAGGTGNTNGGSSANGGAVASGGYNQGGSVSNVGGIGSDAGGSPSTGGSTTANGGTPSGGSGVAVEGGTSNTGGSVAASGGLFSTGGGVAASGGLFSTGGSVAASGGLLSTGGIAEVGGSSSSIATAVTTTGGSSVSAAGGHDGTGGASVAIIQGGSFVVGGAPGTGGASSPVNTVTAPSGSGSGGINAEIGGSSTAIADNGGATNAAGGNVQAGGAVTISSNTNGGFSGSAGMRSSIGGTRGNGDPTGGASASNAMSGSAVVDAGDDVQSVPTGCNCRLVGIPTRPVSPLSLGVLGWLLVRRRRSSSTVAP